MEKNKPIGYWLKLLDRLLEEDFDRVLAEDGVHRRHWQVMNVLSRGSATTETVTESLAPFWSGDGAALRDVLGELTRRGWITGAEPYGLTPEGAAAHARLAGRVDRTRRQTMEGLTDEQYAATVDVLRRMAENLRRSAA